MARIAFYAPMKSPNHPTPSGDREMARGLRAALADPAQGIEAELVSEFRCYDGQGDAATQDRLFAEAGAEAERLVQKGGWQAWVTYHNYYKAPDLLGPAVARALGIPYFLVEATRAAKRFGGPWDRFAHAADAACDAADAIFYFTEQDGEGLRPYERPGQPLVRLHPFLRLTERPAPVVPRGDTILSVGMMRAGAKLASYRIIAETLSQLGAGWRSQIVGDGPMRSEVEALFAPFGAQVQFLGEMDSAGLQALYQGARVLLWPGVNEAFGMVYLEAQANSLPVVAEDRPGVRDVVPRGGLVEQGRPGALATAVEALMKDDGLWQSRSREAAAWISDRHLLGAARTTLWSVLGPALEV